jgi:hypothetical protein
MGNLAFFTPADADRTCFGSQVNGLIDDLSFPVSLLPAVSTRHQSVEVSLRATDASPAAPVALSRVLG